jgi:hypothetical protein
VAVTTFPSENPAGLRKNKTRTLISPVAQLRISKLRITNMLVCRAAAVHVSRVLM